MGIKAVPQPPSSPDIAPCDIWLFPKLRGCRYETIEEMKEAVTTVIDTLTKEDFHRAFQKMLEGYNKCIAAIGDYFEGAYFFMCVFLTKVPIRKKSGNLFNDPPTFIFSEIWRIKKWWSLLCWQPKTSTKFCPIISVIAFYVLWWFLKKSSVFAFRKWFTTTPSIVTRDSNNCNGCMLLCGIKSVVGYQKEGPFVAIQRKTSYW